MKPPRRDSEPARFQCRCLIRADQAAFEQLLQASGLSQPALTDALAKGAVWGQRHHSGGVHRKPARIHCLPDTLASGDVLLLNYDPRILAARAPDPLLISDQVNYSIWNKPAGVFSQASKWADHCSIVRMVECGHGKSSYLVHRLDRAARGLIVIAHTRNALQRLTALFEQRQIEKFYRVTVVGRFATPLPFDIRQPVDGRSAHSCVLECRYRESENLTDLVVQIHTGRKHQIRQHLAAAGFPILGDRLYGASVEPPVDLQLVASRLEFQCPFTRKAMKFEL